MMLPAARPILRVPLAPCLLCSLHLQAAADLGVGAEVHYVRYAVVDHLVGHHCLAFGHFLKGAPGPAGTGGSESDRLGCVNIVFVLFILLPLTLL